MPLMAYWGSARSHCQGIIKLARIISTCSKSMTWVSQQLVVSCSTNNTLFAGSTYNLQIAMNQLVYCGLINAYVSAERTPMFSFVSENNNNCPLCAVELFCWQLRVDEYAPVISSIRVLRAVRDPTQRSYTVGDWLRWPYELLREYSDQKHCNVFHKSTFEWHVKVEIGESNWHPQLKNLQLVE
jgi:hypothetical protein